MAFEVIIGLGLAWFAFAIPYNIRKIWGYMDGVKTDASERAVRKSRGFWKKRTKLRD